MKRVRSRIAAALAVLCAACSTGCAISMSTPYVDSADVARLWPYCGNVVNCPPEQEQEHEGLDFHTNANLRPFQAVSDGTVKDVELFLNEGNGFYQVNVRIQHNWKYTVEYAFEPFSPNMADGRQQLANIQVARGQKVVQGQVIGYLLHAGDAPHVHFHLDKGFLVWKARPCPEPYFTDEARASILAIVQSSGFDTMCYQ